MTYENPWTFDGKIFNTEDIKKFVGFVYCIINTLNNHKYIGRKYFYSIRKVKGKKKRQRKDSDWKTYYGSSDILKEDIEKYGVDNFKRIILSLHTTRGDCNYTEVKRQFQHNVLEEEGWYNANISGKYHRKPEHVLDGRVVTTVDLCW
tara:strand:- start:7753 stop:8196 length:444 start_codon:yes stop_codon:yes gene_type:complete